MGERIGTGPPMPDSWASTRSAPTPSAAITDGCSSWRLSWTVIARPSASSEIGLHALEDAVHQRHQLRVLASVESAVHAMISRGS